MSGENTDSPASVIGRAFMLSSDPMLSSLTTRQCKAAGDLAAEMLCDPALVAQLPGAKPLLDVVRAALSEKSPQSTRELIAAIERLDAALDALPPAVRDLIEGGET